MNFLPLTLSPPLEGLVETMFHLQGYCPEHAVERLVPDGFLSMVIELDGRRRHVLDNGTGQPRQECIGAWVSGMQREFMTFSVLPDTELLAVRFCPGGSTPFLHLAASELNDRVVPAVEVLGQGILELREQLLAQNCAAKKLEVAAEYLESRYCETERPPFAITEAVAAISERPTRSQLGDIVRESGYSQRHFIQLFKRFVGPSPKVFQRVLRFSRVIPILQAQEHVQWAELSAECGYYDQAHFIKDFKAFSGINPQDFFDADHERVNFFPAE